ncbi:unnamed protein product [Amoebophrya sp. A25]|nr:unnamed protein product [Amoebophrya sp. A25]|eukprot:GSA25T00011232001.1
MRNKSKRDTKDPSDEVGLDQLFRADDTRAEDDDYVDDVLGEDDEDILTGVEDTGFLEVVKTVVDIDLGNGEQQQRSDVAPAVQEDLESRLMQELQANVTAATGTASVADQGSVAKLEMDRSCTSNVVPADAPSNTHALAGAYDPVPDKTQERELALSRFLADDSTTDVDILQGSTSNACASIGRSSLMTSTTTSANAKSAAPASGSDNGGSSSTGRGNSTAPVAMTTLTPVSKENPSANAGSPAKTPMGLFSSFLVEELPRTNNIRLSRKEQAELRNRSTSTTSAADVGGGNKGNNGEEEQHDQLVQDALAKLRRVLNRSSPAKPNDEKNMKGRGSSSRTGRAIAVNNEADEEEEEEDRESDEDEDDESDTSTDDENNGLSEYKSFNRLKLNAKYVEERLLEAERARGTGRNDAADSLDGGLDARKMRTSGQDYFLSLDPDVERIVAAVEKHEDEKMRARKSSTLNSFLPGDNSSPRPASTGVSPRDLSRDILEHPGPNSPKRMSATFAAGFASAYSPDGSSKSGIQSLLAGSPAGGKVVSTSATTMFGEPGTEKGQFSDANLPERPISPNEEDIAAVLGKLNQSLTSFKDVGDFGSVVSPSKKDDEANEFAEDGDDVEGPEKPGENDGPSPGKRVDLVDDVLESLESCKSAVDKILQEATATRPIFKGAGAAERDEAVEKLAEQLRDNAQGKPATPGRIARRARVDRLVQQVLQKEKQTEVDAEQSKYAVKVVTAEEREKQKLETLRAEQAAAAVEQERKRKRRTELNKVKKKASEKVLAYFETKYPVMSEVVSSFENWKQTGSDAIAELIWSDTSIPAERFTKLKSYQKINHFVGMCAITRKNNLGRNLIRMKKYYPKEYKFFPDTWILPTDMSDFKAQFQNQSKNKTYIIKPDNGCQGRGIFLTREWPSHIDMTMPLVAQKYLAKPLLLDGHKFDLRLYVLVTGCDPLRIYIHEKGLVRLASERYVAPKSKNLDKQMVHLTNYSINAKNPKFEENDDVDDGRTGHKRSLTAVIAYLAEQGWDTDKLFAEIEELIVKTLISIQPSLRHVYRSCQPEDVENNNMCFEILGFDVMIDSKGKPWLLEVNHAPSFATESEVDRDAKYNVLRDTFAMLQLNPDRRKRYRKEMLARAEARVMGAPVLRGGKLTGNRFVSGVQAAVAASKEQKESNSAASSPEKVGTAATEQDDANPSASGTATENKDSGSNSDTNVEGQAVQVLSGNNADALIGSTASLGDGGVAAPITTTTLSPGKQRTNGNAGAGNGSTAEPTTLASGDGKAVAMVAEKPSIAFGSTMSRGSYESPEKTTLTKRGRGHNKNKEDGEQLPQWPTVAFPILKELDRCEEVNAVLETTQFRKLYPPPSIHDFVNHYGKYVDTAFDIWETLTGSNSRRYRCLDWIDDQLAAAQKRLEAEKSGKNSQKKPSVKEKLEKELEATQDEINRRAQSLRSRARSVGACLPPSASGPLANATKHPITIISNIKSGEGDQKEGDGTVEGSADANGDEPSTTDLLSQVANGSAKSGSEEGTPTNGGTKGQGLSSTLGLVVSGQGMSAGSQAERPATSALDDTDASPGTIASIVADRLRKTMLSRGHAGVAGQAGIAPGSAGNPSTIPLVDVLKNQPLVKVDVAMRNGGPLVVPNPLDANTLLAGAKIVPPASTVTTVTPPTAPTVKSLAVVDAPAVPTAADGTKATEGKKTTSRYAHLKIGDVVQVLTNLGWEKVVVRRKLENGRLDILFQDGETMHDVMPRLHDKVLGSSGALNSTTRSSGAGQRNPSSSGYGNQNSGGLLATGVGRLSRQNHTRSAHLTPLRAGGSKPATAMSISAATSSKLDGEGDSILTHGKDAAISSGEGTGVDSGAPTAPPPLPTKGEQMSASTTTQGPPSGATSSSEAQSTSASAPPASSTIFLAPLAGPATPAAVGGVPTSSADQTSSDPKYSHFIQILSEPSKTPMKVGNRGAGAQTPSSGQRRTTTSISYASGTPGALGPSAPALIISNSSSFSAAPSTPARNEQNTTASTSTPTPGTPADGRTTSANSGGVPAVGGAGVVGVGVTPSASGPSTSQSPGNPPLLPAANLTAPTAGPPSAPSSPLNRGATASNPAPNALTSSGGPTSSQLNASASAPNFHSSSSTSAGDSSNSAAAVGASPVAVDNSQQTLTQHLMDPRFFGTAFRGLSSSSNTGTASSQARPAKSAAFNVASNLFVKPMMHRGAPLHTQTAAPPSSVLDPNQSPAGSAAGGASSGTTMISGGNGGVPAGSATAVSMPTTPSGAHGVPPASTLTHQYHQYSVSALGTSGVGVAAHLKVSCSPSTPQLYARHSSRTGNRTKTLNQIGSNIMRSPDRNSVWRQSGSNNFQSPDPKALSTGAVGGSQASHFLEMNQHKAPRNLWSMPAANSHVRRARH